MGCGKENTEKERLENMVMPDTMQADVLTTLITTKYIHRCMGSESVWKENPVVELKYVL